MSDAGRPAAGPAGGSAAAAGGDRQPVVLVGVRQLVERDADPAEALDPLEMLVQVAEGAAEDARAGARLLRELDLVGIIDVMGWHPSNAPRLLAERIGAKPRREIVSAVGGETPIAMTNYVADAIARGETRAAFVGGSSAVRTQRNARKAGVTLAWPQGGEGEPELLGQLKPGTTEMEQAYGLLLPIQIYPIFENALRAHRGLDLGTHFERMGALMHRFTKVAARNPYAWFPVERSPRELVEVTPANRMIAFPYPKYLNAVIETNQAAGVLLCSEEAARSLGIPEDRRVYWCGGAQAAEDPWFVSARPAFHDCPAMAATLRAALDRAGTGIDGVGHIDLYSCFPVAVEMACDALGLSEDDPRNFTVTGGLPYAGGPGNNYTLHSLAAMADVLRADPGSRGLVSGNGWYLTKHSAAVLSTEPPGATVAPAGVEASRADQAPELVAEASGPARVETYTILYDREGAPERGIVMGRLDDGRRFLANTASDRRLLEDFAAVEEVGRRGRVTHAGGANRFDPE